MRINYDNANEVLRIIAIEGPIPEDAIAFPCIGEGITLLISADQLQILGVVFERADSELARWFETSLPAARRNLRARITR